MDKIDFKGSVILNPVPVVLITSKNNEGKTNVFTVGWTGTICHTLIPLNNNLEGIYE